MNQHTRSDSGTMRLGYLLRMYPRFSQTFVVNEILELERQGVALCIASLKKPSDGVFHESISRVRAKADYLAERFGEAPRKILSAHWSTAKRTPSGSARALGATLRHLGANLTDLWQAGLLLKWAEKRNLKHVHVHFGTHEATVAYLAHLLGGPSYSMTLHAYDIFRNNVDRLLLARKINASRFTVTVSEYNRRHLIQRCAADPDRIRTSYNGIDLDTFCPNGDVRTPFTILAVGRLIEKKGFIHLLRAVRLLRDRGVPARCTIIGDGPEKSRLKHAINALELRKAVTLKGALNQAQVRKRMLTSTCVALPCVRAADGNVDALPTVLLEAMACGCPCVSTDLSGIPEIIEHGRSGLLVPPGDEQALASALGRLLESTNMQQGLAAAGRQRAEQRFDVRTNVGRLKDWFCAELRESVPANFTQSAVPEPATGRMLTELEC